MHPKRCGHYLKCETSLIHRHTSVELCHASTVWETALLSVTQDPVQDVIARNRIINACRQGCGVGVVNTCYTMFNDEDDLAAFEDELYREESSSDESIDSEVEAYLYSQVHYSQNLNEDNIDELDDQRKEDDVPEKVTSLKISAHEKKAVIVISDSDDVRASDSSAVLILSESLEEDCIYSSKAKGKLLSAAKQPKSQLTPKAPLKGKKLSKAPGAKSPSSGKSYKDGLVQEVFVIRGSSEEEVEDVKEYVVLSSDSDLSDVENWMLLGRAREEGDASIQLNIKGQRYAPDEGL
ncbi:unnamed protein product [Ranitomeya imitator]|uniref:Uncharacterized protein n=1 Tax=Ranitomeya imitator TaxID=111125 RepID=A0ABN9LHQ9_9NEOB|nr:unnamed protein product [Ranitomeya imitator]